MALELIDNRRGSSMAVTHEVTPDSALANEYENITPVKVEKGGDG